MWPPTSLIDSAVLVDRVGFYTPSLISEETLGELADEMAMVTEHLP